MSNEIKSYRDLIAWQKAFDVGLDIYNLTMEFPDREKFGLTVQIHRSAVSISSNIAEGYGRQSTADYIRFLRIARGSMYEVETQLLFAIRLGYITEKQFEFIEDKLAECGRVLAGLIRSLGG